MHISAINKINYTNLQFQLGSHLADAFLAQGHQVFGCDNLSERYEPDR